MENYKYLEDGIAVEVVDETKDGKYVVAEVFECGIGDGEDYDTRLEVSENLRIVDKVYETPPENAYHRLVKLAKDELNKVRLQVSEQRGNLRKISLQKKALEEEIVKIKSKKTDWKRMIVDRSEIADAKRLTVVTQDFKILDLKKGQFNAKQRISFEISAKEGKHWGMVLDWGTDSWKTKKINSEYGVMIDKTDEELRKILQKILQDTPVDGISPYDLLHTVPVGLLSKEMRIRRSEIVAKSATEKIDDANDSIKRWNLTIAKQEAILEKALKENEKASNE